MFKALTTAEVTNAVNKHMTNTVIWGEDIEEGREIRGYLISEITRITQYGEDHFYKAFFQVADMMYTYDSGYPKFYAEITAVFADLLGTEIANRAADSWAGYFFSNHEDED